MRAPKHPSDDPRRTKRPEPCSRFRLGELRQAIRPIRLRYFATVGSTQSAAERLVRAGELDPPAVLLTSRQTAGRGRGEASWWSSRGCLTLTLVLPSRPALPPHELSVRVAVAVADALGSRVWLKWPNDLVGLVDGRPRKLGGILVHRLSAAELIGIGLNVNVRSRGALPPDLRGRATSLQGLYGKEADLTRLAAAVVNSVASRLTRQPLPTFETALSEYRSRDALRNRAVSVAVSGRTVSGTAAGIDEVGRLILRTGRHLQKIPAGHVLRW